MTNDHALIDVESVNKRFGDVWAVRDLSFEVPKGQIFCLLGPSGSGKTTTIRMLLAVYAPDSGSLRVFGHPPASFGRSLYKRIGYMPQHFVLYPTLTVEENLNFMGQLYGMGLFRRRERIRDMLEFLELEQHRRKSAAELSGGMKRRLALAAAFLHEPELLVLDEPTAGIDPILREKFWDEFRRLNAEGTSFLVTTQYVSEASYADQVAIVSEGELVAHDTPANLRQRAYGGELVDVDATGITSSVIAKLKNRPEVIAVEDASYNYIRLIISEEADISEVVTFLENQGVTVEKTTELDPAFDEVFVRLVRAHREAHEEGGPRRLDEVSIPGGHAR